MTWWGYTALILSVVISGLIIGVSIVQVNESRKRTINGTPAVTRTDAGTFSVYTVQHDGHSFVCTYNGGVLHHPNCPCLEPEGD